MKEKFKLIESCGGCPQVFDIYYNDEYVGYMQLRHGYFRVVYSKTDEVVYEGEPPNSDGIFDWDVRDLYLNRGCQAIWDTMQAENNVDEKENLFEIGYADD
jgi:hypothetical protein